MTTLQVERNLLPQGQVEKEGNGRRLTLTNVLAVEITALTEAARRKGPKAKLSLGGCNLQVAQQVAIPSVWVSVCPFQNPIKRGRIRLNLLGVLSIPQLRLSTILIYSYTVLACRQRRATARIFDLLH
jgi:hypothetical protein